ncbi:hypothetical protein EVAR_21461_1 [Eumeta japonica]|uniref:Uncharacterized protein n=1 Tax=Eumeta variegata TaxID=151549 RepID=A0A4C1VJN7_EUMVA|nr:hypothetical protein EVAR_21461_1 [Eumeta japonica]
MWRTPATGQDSTVSAVHRRRPEAGPSQMATPRTRETARPSSASAAEIPTRRARHSKTKVKRRQQTRGEFAANRTRFL